MSLELVAGGAAPRKSRKRWSEARKRELVALSYQPGVSVAQVAREHDVNANQIFNWRRRMGGGRSSLPCGEATTASPFAVIDVVEERRQAAHGVLGGQIEIELASGVRVRVDAGVSEAALVRVLSAVKVVA